MSSPWYLERRDNDELGLSPALWRSVDVFRGFSLLYAWITYFGFSHQEYRHQVGAVFVLIAMAIWTGFFFTRRERGWWMQIGDLTAAVGSVLILLVIDDPTRIGSGAATIARTWAAAPVLGWALWRGWVGGVFAALMVALANFIVADPVNGGTVSSVMILLLAGYVVGYGSALHRDLKSQLAQVLSRNAAVRERERLAADIHDSVLQALALIERRAIEIGGPTVSLGELAGQEQRRLRQLVSATTVSDPTRETVDIVRSVSRVAAEHHAGPSFAGPADSVLVPEPVVAAVCAAVAAALDNVMAHAGSDASSWVFIEHDKESVTVSVRDDGVGCDPERFETARREGRLGVHASISGRISDVGGATDFSTFPGEGVEVQMRVPLR